jgi:hypothetical protein
MAGELRWISTFFNFLESFELEALMIFLASGLNSSKSMASFFSSPSSTPARLINSPSSFLF